MFSLNSCSTDGIDQPENQQNEIAVSGKTKDTIIRISVGDDKVPVYISLPENCNSEPLPAVVVLHGSDGMWTNDDPGSGEMTGQFREWQEILSANCIVGAFVDSYSGRGVANRTGKWRELPFNFRISAQFIRPLDANATLNLLQNMNYSNGQSVVKAEDVALLGFSDGASATAATLIDTSRIPTDFKWTQSQDGVEYDSADGVLPPPTKPEIGFSGGVFYYGGSVGYNYWGRHPCSNEAIEENVFYPYAPMLYHIPSDDALTENTLCLTNMLSAKQAPVNIFEYEGVPHGFDNDGLPESSIARTRTIRWLNELWDNN